MIKTIIVDDEPLAIDVIESFIQKMPSLELVAKCENAFEANDILRDHHIDLMFLDIQMPQINGIEFLKSLDNPPCTIFTTAFSEYAMDGYDLNVADYLLKPISIDRFMKAVNKATEKITSRKGEMHEGMSTDTYFFVKADKKLVKVNFDEILYVEGLKDYVIIRTETGRVITLQTMKSLEEKLPAQKFKRIHRSFIVNINKITALDGNEVEIMEKGAVKQLPIGKNYRDELLDMVNEKKI